MGDIEAETSLREEKEMGENQMKEGKDTSHDRCGKRRERERERAAAAAAEPPACQAMIGEALGQAWRMCGRQSLFISRRIAGKDLRFFIFSS